jgi:hypothetical protein
MANGGEFIQDKNGDLNSPQVDNSLFSKLIQTPQFVYFNGLLPCLLGQDQGEFVQDPFIQ